MANYDNKEVLNKFVGILEDGGYVFVDYLFESGDLHGATGTILRPVSKEYVEERIEELKDYEWSPLAEIYDEQDTPKGWEEWINQTPRRELEEFAVDPSASRYWDKTKELCKEHEDFEFYMTDCYAGGRIFSKGKEANPDSYEYLENPDVLESAKAAERGEYFD